MVDLFGLPQSTINRTLRDLAAAGAITVMATAKGTAVSLADGTATAH